MDESLDDAASIGAKRAPLRWTQITLEWGDGGRHAWMFPPEQTLCLMEKTPLFLRPSNEYRLVESLAKALLEKSVDLGAMVDGLVPFGIQGRTYFLTEIPIVALVQGPVLPLAWKGGADAARWIDEELERFGLACARFGPYPQAEESREGGPLGFAKKRLVAASAQIEALELRSRLPKPAASKTRPSL
jgi:hypothetical protein